MNSVGQTTPKTYITCPCLKTWSKLKLEFEFKFKFEFEQQKKMKEKEKELAQPLGPSSGARGPSPLHGPARRAHSAGASKPKKEKGQAATGPGPLASTPLHGPDDKARSSALNRDDSCISEEKAAPCLKPDTTVQTCGEAHLGLRPLTGELLRADPEGTSLSKPAHSFHLNSSPPRRNLDGFSTAELHVFRFRAR